MMTLLIGYGITALTASCAVLALGMLRASRRANAALVAERASTGYAHRAA